VCVGVCAWMMGREMNGRVKVSRRGARADDEADVGSSVGACGG